MISLVKMTRRTEGGMHDDRGDWWQASQVGAAIAPKRHKDRNLVSWASFQVVRGSPTAWRWLRYRSWAMRRSRSVGIPFGSRSQGRRVSRLSLGGLSTPVSESPFGQSDTGFFISKKISKGFNSKCQNYLFGKIAPNVSAHLKFDLFFLSKITFFQSWLKQNRLKGSVWYFFLCRLDYDSTRRIAWFAKLRVGTFLRHKKEAPISKASNNLFQGNGSRHVEKRVGLGLVVPLCLSWK